MGRERRSCWQRLCGTIPWALWLVLLAVKVISVAEGWWKAGKAKWSFLGGNLSSLVQLPRCGREGMWARNPWSVCVSEEEPREQSSHGAAVPGGPLNLLRGHLPARRELRALILLGSQQSKPYILWHALTFNHPKEKHTTHYPRAQWACLFSAPCILFIEVLQHGELKQTACDHCLGGGK